MKVSARRRLISGLFLILVGAVLVFASLHIFLCSQIGSGKSAPSAITKVQLRAIASGIEAYSLEYGLTNVSVAALEGHNSQGVRFVVSDEGRIWRDAWGHPIHLRIDSNRLEVLVISFGADGVEGKGKTDEDADLIVVAGRGVQPRGNGNWP